MKVYAVIFLGHGRAYLQGVFDDKTLAYSSCVEGKSMVIGCHLNELVTEERFRKEAYCPKPASSGVIAEAAVKEPSRKPKEVKLE